MHLVVIPQGIFSKNLSSPAFDEFPAPLVSDRLSLLEPEFDTVTLISGWKDGETTTRYPNGNVHHSVRTSDSRIISSFRYLRYAIQKLISLRSQDIVVLNFNPSLIGSVLAKVSRALGIEFVTYFLGMPEQFEGSRKTIASYQSLLKTSTRCICSSPVFRDRLQQIADVDVAIVPHGINPIFEPDPAIERDDSLVLYIGRFSPEKRISLLVDAFADVIETNSGARLVLIGARTNSDRTQVISQAKELGVADQIRVKERIPREEVPKWMNRARVFVLPSRNEAFGMVLLEAMACGTPPIGMDSGSVPWVIDDGGLVCKDSDELCESISLVLSNDEFYYKLRERAVNRATDFPYQEWGRNIRNAILGEDGYNEVI